LNSSFEDTFVFPKLEEIKEAQHQIETPPEDLHMSDGVLVDVDDRVWIPNLNDLRLRLMIIAHSSLSGHRGVDTTLKAIQGRFVWDNVVKDVTAFCKNCYHCLTSKGPEAIPRPLGHQMHSNHSAELLHMDFLSMPESVPTGADGHSHNTILVIKDDFTGFCELVPSDSASALVTANAISQWIARFGCPKFLVSDQGSHFVNQLITELTDLRKVKIHFTVAYSPQSNGTVEKLNSTVVVLFRALVSEFRLDVSQWPSLLNVVQYVINQTPSARLGGRAPITVLTGLAAQSPLDLVVGKDESFISITSDQLKEETNLAIDDALIALDEMHKDVVKSKEHHQAVNSRSTNKNRGGKPINFIPGDFVLAAQHAHSRQSKVHGKWSGPHVVELAISPWVYRVRNMVNDKVREVHISQLMLYRDDRLGEVLDQAHKEQLMYSDTGYEVQKFKKLRVINGHHEILTSWRGFGSDGDSFEPVDNMVKDVPELLKQFLLAQKDDPLARKVFRKYFR
jgi:hypothetical protein